MEEEGNARPEDDRPRLRGSSCSCPPPSPLPLQYTGQDIVFISPDSYNLSALQAAVVGVDLRSHDLYKFAPGEVG
jgi:hypothetical protein